MIRSQSEEVRGTTPEEEEEEEEEEEDISQLLLKLQVFWNARLCAFLFRPSTQDCWNLKAYLSIATHLTIQRHIPEGLEL